MDFCSTFRFLRHSKEKVSFQSVENELQMCFSIVVVVMVVVVIAAAISNRSIPQCPLFSFVIS